MDDALTKWKRHVTLMRTWAMRTYCYSWMVRRALRTDAAGRAASKARPRRRGLGGAASLSAPPLIGGARSDPAGQEVNTYQMVAFAEGNKQRALVEVLGKISGAQGALGRAMASTLVWKAAMGAGIDVKLRYNMLYGDESTYIRPGDEGLSMAGTLKKNFEVAGAARTGAP